MIEVGTIIRKKYNTSASNSSYTYYQLCDGMFTIDHPHDGIIGKFEGKHFVCKGSDYFYGLFGTICGLDILDEDFEVVDKLPFGLIK